MKPHFMLTALFSIAAVTEAVEVGELVNTSEFVADGVHINFIYGMHTSVKPELSTRFFDSEKGGPWTKPYSDGTEGDSLMCWSHASSNLIQYWQTYYGVFYKGNRDLPYGSDYEYEKKTSSIVDDPTKLNVAKDIYEAWHLPGGPRDSPGVLKNATDYFFTYSSSGGGYYVDYFDAVTKTSYPVTQSYSEVSGLTSLTQNVLSAFGIDAESKVKNEMGLIPYIGVSYDVVGDDGVTRAVGHALTCYGFTTSSDGSITSLLLSNSDDENARIVQAYVREIDGKLQMFEDANCSERWRINTQNDWYISSVSHIVTPEVMKNMLAEYSNTEGEALVWNGATDGEWKTQPATTEELPTEATGWDVHVNGEAVEVEHHDYYHSYATDGRDVRFDSHSGNKEVTITGTVTPGDIEIAEGDYIFKAGEAAEIAGSGEVIIRSGASLTTEVLLGERALLMETGAVLRSEKEIVVTGEFRTVAAIQEAATFNLRSAAAPGVTVEADLSFSSGVVLDLAAAVDMKGHKLSFSDSESLFTLASDADDFMFSNIGTLSVGEQEYTTDEVADFVASSSTEQAGYRLVFSNGTLSMQAIPEPTTATLSLLALAGLVLRRRR